MKYLFSRSLGASILCFVVMYFILHVEGYLPYALVGFACAILVKD